jgi:hypothetical protein
MIIENDDTFEIADTDLVVTTCRRDSWSLRLELESRDTKWTLAIGGAFSMTRITDEEPISAAQLVPDLVSETVLSARARKADGELEIRFTHGWVLAVEPDLDYEAWEMYSSRGERLIAVPGDGVAKWGAVVTTTDPTS